MKILLAHDGLVRRSALRSSARVIVSLHVASGALAGALAGSRRAALAAGPLTHLAGDRMPHQDIASRRFEIVSGTGLLLLLAVRRGPLDPAVLGAVAAAVPDAEHVFPLPRPGGRKLFPSHRVRRWHRAGGVPAWAQLLAAGSVLGALAARRSTAR
ncbi:MAG TPA: hypothetical protein VHF23_01550 [Gaiellaceae bacterium]|nr:hypothetical protein [Gaiellaceae bacterium]